MSDVVNKIALFTLDVDVEYGLMMGWGSQKRSSIKNVFRKPFLPTDLSQYLQSLSIKFQGGRSYKESHKGLVNENESNLLKGYGLNTKAHTSVVNILMKFYIS